MNHHEAVRRTRDLLRRADRGEVLDRDAGAALVRFGYAAPADEIAGRYSLTMSGEAMLERLSVIKCECGWRIRRFAPRPIMGLVATWHQIANACGGPTYF